MYEAKNKQKRYVTVDVAAGIIKVQATWETLRLSDYKEFRIAKSGERVMYECEHCHKLFFDKFWFYTTTKKWRKKSAVALDHVIPVIDPKTGFTTWDDYIERMFNGKVQLLCHSCHNIKTTQENGERTDVRRSKRTKSPAKPTKDIVKKVSKCPKKNTRSK